MKREKVKIEPGEAVQHFKNQEEFEDITKFYYKPVKFSESRFYCNQSFGYGDYTVQVTEF